jgi:ABC-2 type transport system permease protein
MGKASGAIARRTFADSRVRTLSFGLFFALVALADAVGYRHTYPTLAERLDFARTFGTNKTVQLFYGAPHELVTVGGYTAWRFGGIVAVFAAFWALLATVRATRGEEEAGRQELVLAAPVGRRSAFLAAMSAVAVAAALLWLACLLGLAAARLPLGGSAFLALAVVSPVPVFAGAGALAGQLAPTRRLALELGSAALALAFLLRVVADTSAHLGWVRWTTPLGWAEELRPFADPRPAVLLLPLVVGMLLLVPAGAIAVRRDIGTGLLRANDEAAPRLRLLTSPTRLAFRRELGALAGWAVGTGLFALVVGLLSTSFTKANLSAGVREQLHRIGGTSIATPAGAIGFYFLFFVLVISLFGCSQVAAARHEEADQQLETVLAQPVARRRWLGGRLLLAAAGAVGLALVAAVLAWVGAASQHAGISATRMLEAGANTLPAALLFLALGALAFALVPRASIGIAYGLVSLGFVWDLFGALLGAPGWLLDLTPFEHVGLVPGQPFRTGAAVVMLAIAAAASLAALWSFDRRDLAGA